MWKALQTVADGYPALAALDLDELIARGEDQRSRIEDSACRSRRSALAHTASV